MRKRSAMTTRMTTLQIEALLPDQAEGAAPLSVEAGWNQIAADWRLMLGEGRGFGVRDASGHWIASALVLPLGPAISWISMVLVTKPSRRQGHGTRLLQRCFAEIEATGVTAGLDATELGRPVYLPLGFRDVYPLSRWRAEAGQRQAVEPPEGVRVRSAGGARTCRASWRSMRRIRGLRAGASSITCWAGRRRWRMLPSAAMARWSAMCWGGTDMPPCMSGPWWPRRRGSGSRSSRVRWPRRRSA